MRRKSFVLAVLVGICIFNLADRPPSAMAVSHPTTTDRSEACVQPLSAAGTGAVAPLTFPLCNSGYCATHQSDVCTCPSGTIRAGLPAPCDTWHADCNDL
jgi:hypothetical protein